MDITECLLSVDNGKQGWIFGFRIPFLPDFLLDHTLLGREPDQRIAKHCRQWTQLVGGLWRQERDVTYALRFDWTPSRLPVSGGSQTARGGCVEAHVLGRAHAPNDGRIADAIAHDVERALRAFGFQPERLARRDSHPTKPDLEALCRLRAAAAFEVHQQEYLVPFRDDMQSADFKIPEEFLKSGSTMGGAREFFAVVPWWGPGGPYLVPFNSLTAQSQAVSIHVLLQPTTLDPKEVELLAGVARGAESLAQRATAPKQIGGVTIQTSQSLTDPQLRWAARVYAADLRRLSHPFLTAIYCLSDDNASVKQMANAFANMIREELAFETPIGESERMQSGAECVSCERYVRQVQLACSLLMWEPASTPMSDSKSPNPHLRRLRYLVDARGAATAFRFPVSVRGGVPGIRVKQRPPDFHPGPRTDQPPPDEMELGKFHVGGVASVKLDDFTQHALITGFTGSGKTNTVLWLLHQFWNPPAERKRIPSLVIESAKKEYRGLRNADGFKGTDGEGKPVLRIYTLGNESCAPLRFNPFELIAGVRVEAHVGRLQTSFEAALPPVGPLPSIIAEALHKLYPKFGWELTDVGSENPKEDTRRFPTMRDFYEMVEEVVKSRGYVGEVRSNVEAAVTGRIRPLLMGSKGLMFSERKSNPTAAELFTKPTILELNDLNEQDKSLVMMFLLTLLREFRETNARRELQHVTVVEEAHNVLANVPSAANVEGGMSDIRAKAVQAFCNMLSEVRAYGEGLIISDQSPEKLARDAMRNTNVQIAHQLRDAHDREAIANAMIMDEEQRDYLGKVEVGRAAVFYTGLQKATFITVPLYVRKETDDPEVEVKWCGFNDCASPQESDEQVRKHMSALTGYRCWKPWRDCSLCLNENEGCRFQKQILTALAPDSPYLKRLENALKRFADADNPATGRERWMLLTSLITRVMGIGSRAQIDAAWCFMLHLWGRYRTTPLTEDDRRAFEEAFPHVV